MTKEEAVKIKDEILRKEGSVDICNTLKIDGVVRIQDVLNIINEHIEESKKVEIKQGSYKFRLKE